MEKLKLNTSCKRIIVQCFMSLLVLLSGCTEQPQTTRALFIIVDGIPADVIERIDPPALKEIASTGGYARAHVGGDRGRYNETPTISAPGYTCLLTGTWANKHNVWDNDIADPNYHYWSIFRTITTANPALTTAVFSTWTDNRTKLVGEGLDATGRIKLSHSFDGLELDTVPYPREEKAGHIRKIDDAVATEAARVVLEQGPDLSWVYLEYTDDIGHQFGDSDEQTQAVLAADEQIGGIWKSIKQREQQYREDWLIVITTDHGRDSVNGRNHGGQSDRERNTWIVTNGKQLNAHFSRNPGVVDIFPAICRHLGVGIPDKVAQELDGVSFLGEVQVDGFTGERMDDEVVITWSYIGDNKEETGEVFVSTTNNFKNGGTDAYTSVGRVALDAGSFRFPLPDSSFAKVIMKTKDQWVNTWIVAK